MIWARFGERKTLKQIAAELSEKEDGRAISISTVSYRLRKLKTKIREKMDFEDDKYFYQEYNKRISKKFK